MYLIDHTYFQGANREIPNLDEADSKSFAELERLIDDKCRLFLHYFLTPKEVEEFDSHLVQGFFPEITTGIPQKWIDLVNGKTYDGLVWNGLLQKRGTSRNSLLADYVYHSWLESQASYMTGVGDAKGNPKGASLVNPTQRIVTVWNEFVFKYQSSIKGNYLGTLYGNSSIIEIDNSKEVSLLRFLSDHAEDYTSENRKFFEPKNQLGI